MFEGTYRLTGLRLNDREYIMVQSTKIFVDKHQLNTLKVQSTEISMLKKYTNTYRISLK